MTTRLLALLLSLPTACITLAPPLDPIHVRVVGAYMQPTPYGQNDRYYLVIEREGEHSFERTVVQVNQNDWMRSRRLLDACMWPEIGGGVKVGPC
jgi:hypothetical protein